MTAFGAEFRKAREARGLTFDKIAGETRISTRFLKAIEDEEFHILPGGIFNRGFIRSYAQHLGLDPEQAIADYERLSNAPVQPPEAAPTVELQSEPAADAGARKAERDFYPIAIVVLALLLLIFYLVNQNSRTESSIQPVPDANNPAAAPPQPAPPPPQPPDLQAPVSAPVPLPNPGPLTPDPAPPAAVATAPPLVLELEASTETWISLTADGNVLEQVNLQPGNTRRYEAANSIDILIGNAGGLIMKINGRELGLLGREGQTRRFSITPENAARIGA
jgi:cytoskeletal protein RodZ